MPHIPSSPDVSKLQSLRHTNSFQVLNKCTSHFSCTFYLISSSTFSGYEAQMKQLVLYTTLAHGNSIFIGIFCYSPRNSYCSHRGHPVCVQPCLQLTAPALIWNLWQYCRSWLSHPCRCTPVLWGTASLATTPKGSACSKHNHRNVCVKYVPVFRSEMRAGMKKRESACDAN